MWTAAASWSRTARAAQTQESMPPLRSTTARDLRLLSGMVRFRCLSIRNGSINHVRSERNRSSDAFYGRIPNELMQLQAEPAGNVVGKHPLRQFLRVEQTVRTVASPGRVFAECGRKQDCGHTLRQIMPFGELPGKFVVRPAAQNELDFIVCGQCRQVLQAKRAALARVRTLHVDDLDDARRNTLQRTLSAGLEQNRVPIVQQSLHEGDDFALLQHGLAARNLD